MKKHLTSFALLISMIPLLNSCTTSSLTVSERKSVIASSKENTTTCFVKMNDGSIREYSSLKLVTGPLKAPYLLADGKIKIKASQITAYQNKDHYAVSQNNFSNGRKTYVATETLPGFAIRTVKGKLNVYCKKFYNGQVAVDEYFLQAGTDGKIQAYSADLMNELVKDKAEALALFNSKQFKGNAPEKLHATAQLYNGGQFMTKN